MGDVLDLETHRLKRSKDSDMIVASCMHCGDEFPWGRRFDHRCEKGARANHPST